MVPALVEPCQELLEVDVDRQRSGLVDDLATRGEVRAEHGPAAAMAVAQVALHGFEATRIAA